MAITELKDKRYIVWEYERNVKEGAGAYKRADVGGAYWVPVSGITAGRKHN